MTISTFSDVRLGDNLAHLHFLRAVAKQNPNLHFEHGAHACYLPQLIEVVADLPNIILRDLRHINRKRSINAWKNRDKFWETHPKRNDYGPFMLEWFRQLAGEMGVRMPFRAEADLLFDYPAIKDTSCEKFDVLLVNSEPLSGQWRTMDIEGVDRLALELSERLKIITTKPVRPFIPCTQSMRLSVTGIGGISRFCRAVIMVSTGSSWATFNIWNRKSVELRVIFIEDEKVNIAPNTVHTNSPSIAREILRDHKFL